MLRRHRRGAEAEYSFCHQRRADRRARFLGGTDAAPNERAASISIITGLNLRRAIRRWPRRLNRLKGSEADCGPLTPCLPSAKFLDFFARPPGLSHQACHPEIEAARIPRIGESTRQDHPASLQNQTDSATYKDLRARGMYRLRPAINRIGRRVMTKPTSAS